MHARMTPSVPRFARSRQVTLKTLVGRSVVIDVDQNDTLFCLKAYYADASGVPVSQQRVVFEASHTRLGGMVGLGVTPGQRLGLHHTPYRDACFVAMHQTAAAAARHIASMEGAVHDTKRVKLSQFDRGHGVVMHNQAHKTTGFE